MNSGKSTTINDINERINSLYAAAVSISPLHDGQAKAENTERFNGILSEIAEAKRQAVKILIAGGKRNERRKKNRNYL